MREGADTILVYCLYRAVCLSLPGSDLCSSTSSSSEASKQESLKALLHQIFHDLLPLMSGYLCLSCFAQFV